MKKIVFIAGPDDKKQSRLNIKNKKMTIRCIGMLPLLESDLNSIEITNNSQLVILGVHKELRLPENSSNIKIVNLVGDADGCKSSLKAIESLVNNLSLKNVVNKPADIYKTSRTSLPDLLKNINNVRIANSKTVTACNTQELIYCIGELSFSYPFIIRLPGYHNSKYMRKISSEDELFQIEDWFDLSEDFTLLDYIPNLSVNGYYRKTRIAVINGQFFPQHLLSSEHWCVGVENRYKLMMRKESLRKDEQIFLQSFEKEIYPKFKDSLNEIHRRIGLDIYGIDCFLNNNGEIVVFEANPCMDLISMWLGPNNEYNYKKPYRAAVREAIVKLLSS